MGQIVQPHKAAIAAWVFLLAAILALASWDLAQAQASAAPGAALQGSNSEHTAVNERVPSAETIEPRSAFDRANVEHWSANFIAKAKQRGQFVGAGIAVFSADGPVLMKGMGHGNFEEWEAVHPDVTLLPLGDFGNRFLLEALFDLEANNRLSLTQPAELFLTRLSLPPEYRHLKVEDLFSQQSGLTASVRGTETRRGKRTRNNLSHIQAMLARSKKEKPDFPVRSSLGSALAGLIVEDVSGRGLDENLRHVFQSNGVRDPFFNAANSPLPKHISHDHLISKYGEIEIHPSLASAKGFLGANGIYLTLSDLVSILSNDLKALEKGADLQRSIIRLLFEETKYALNDQSFVMLRYQATMGASSLDIRFIPDLDIGVVAIVNSARKEPDLSTAKGRLPLDPPIGASDITNNLLRDLGSQGNNAVPSESSPTTNSLNGALDGALDGAYVKTALPLLGPDRLLEVMTPKVRVRTEPGQGLIVDGDGIFVSDQLTGTSYLNSANGRIVAFETLATSTAPVMRLAGETLERSQGNGFSTWEVIFWASIILQFALIASLRWPVHGTGDRLTKIFGLSGVVVMTLAFILPTTLSLYGHSRTLIDPLYLVTAWAFPVASALAAGTMVMCLVAWRKKYWSEEGFGFTRRLCFTVGSLGLVGLSVSAYKWGLTTLPLT